MSEMNNKELRKSTPVTVKADENQMALDDGRRVKVLSPGMMVFKRFIRNKLAIAGICILVFMFAFSFLGGLISPYGEAQVFHKTDSANKAFADAEINKDYRFYDVNGGDATYNVRTNFKKDISRNPDGFSFVGDNSTYVVEKAGEDFYTIGARNRLGTLTVAAVGDPVFEAAEGAEVPQELGDAAISAVKAGNSAEAPAAGPVIKKPGAAKKEMKEISFDWEGVTYTLEPSGEAFKYYLLGGLQEYAVASKLRVFAFDEQYENLTSSFEFRKICEAAFRGAEAGTDEEGNAYYPIQTFTFTGEDGAETEFRMKKIDEGYGIVEDVHEQEILSISNFFVSSYYQDVRLTRPFWEALKAAIAERATEFEFVNVVGDTEKYDLIKKDNNDNNYAIRTGQNTFLIDQYAPPSNEHPLGTDDHGMDVLTRLMYGGRISLMVGFVVMILENIIGIIIGGISGYFGGWVDTMLMRFVDLFNSIPYYPMMIIAGAIMDSFEVDAKIRLYLMMAIMGIMGWTGVARVVRGQILSLREQEFMVATEATGIPVSRRIFRHLVPNVMPLLIVQATMGLGGIILAEATLSFLGLGIKYPLASWGSIINSSSNLYVMTNCWYLWIPAGLLIVLTVLGFNFVGDGLRDAFDPKMKR